MNTCSILEDGKSAFTGVKDGATVTVEEGAQLVLGNLDVAGDYVITDGFLTAGNLGEAIFEVGKAKIIPHAGLRMVVTDTKGYKTKLDGETAYRNEADTATTFQMPIGVSMRYDHVTQSGWTIRLSGDITLTPQFGDTEQDVKVKGTGGATDTVTGEFTGNFAATFSLGVQAESQNHTTLGLRYGLTAGQEGRQDHSLKLEFRKLF